MKEGWKYKKLGEVCNIDYGTRVVRSRDAGSLYPVYGGGGATFKMDTYNREDCMVISRFGMSEQCTRFVKGKFFLNDSGLTLSMKETCMLQAFLDWQILSLNNTIYSLGRGAAQKNLDAKSFADITISYPLSLSEQRSIVSRLDAAFASIDVLKANAENQLAEARALFNRALTEEMTLKKDWEEKTLKEIGLTQTGTTPSKADPSNYGDFIPFIRPSEIDVDGCGSIEYDSEIKLSEQGLNNGRLFKKHSILMVCIGTVGKVGFCSQDVSCNQQINVLTPFDKYSYKFVYYAMRNAVFNDNVIKIAKSAQATLPIINKGKWEKLSIVIPSLSEQQTIVSHLDALSTNVRKLEEIQRKTLEECDALKQALLKETFE